MPEPYVSKGTRTVPRRGEMSNHLFLFNQKGAHMMLLEEYISIFEEINGVGYMKVIFRLASTHSTMSSY